MNREISLTTQTGPLSEHQQWSKREHWRSAQAFFQGLERRCPGRKTGTPDLAFDGSFKVGEAE